MSDHRTSEEALGPAGGRITMRNRRVTATGEACERQCDNISIVDDVALEMTESFNVTLERTPDLNSRITLNYYHHHRRHPFCAASRVLRARPTSTSAEMLRSVIVS